MRNISTKKITLLAMMLGIIVALELLEGGLFKMPQGGSLSIASLVFMLLIRFLTFKEASLLFILWRLLMLLLGNPFIISPLQGFLEYFVAYSGFLFAYPLVKTQKLGPTLIGDFCANVLRYIIHSVAGVIYFAEYATGPVIQYSFGYNATYMLPTLIVHIILIILLLPQLNKIKSMS